MKKTSFTKILVVLASIMMVAGTAMAQWDGGSASNNDDGGNDQGSNDHTTYADEDDSDSDSSTDGPSAGWDGGSASNNDDGTSTSQEWDGEESTNNDDGSGSTSQWDGQDSQNNDDGSSSEWDGGDSTNNNDGEGEGTQWDGGESSNDDDGDSTRSDDDSENEDSEGNESEEETFDDSTSAASSGGGTSDFAWSDINVLNQTISFQLEPSSVEAGEAVEATGSVENAADADVSVMMDGSVVSQTTTSSDGSFSTHFTAKEVGEHTVTVESEGKESQKQLEVNPSLQVSNIHSTKLNSAGMTRVCADVSSQATPTVTLMQSDISVETKEETGNVCFTTDLSEGSHTLAIQADAEGTTDSAETTVTVTGDSTQISTTDNRSNDTLLASVLQPFVQAFVQLTNMVMSIVP